MIRPAPPTRRSLMAGTPGPGGPAVRWRLWASAPGRHAHPETLPADARWLDAPHGGSVAAMLRGAGLDPLRQAAGVGAPDRPEGRQLGNALDAADWWLQLDWDLQPEERDSADGGLLLGLDGLAGLAQVWLDGRLVLECASAHLGHRLPLDHGPDQRPEAGPHTLVICLRSLDAALTMKLARPRWRTPMVEHQQLRWWRQPLLGRTPGWSPPLPPLGPTGDLWIAPLALGWQAGHATLRAHLARADSRHATLDASLPLEWRGRRPVDGVPPAPHVTLFVQPDGQPQAPTHSVSFTAPAHPGEAWHARLDLPDVERWWPHTHGRPALYRVSAELRWGNAGDTQHAQMPQVRRLDLGRVGFRHLQVERGSGHDFQLRVNGVPVFCRGACWTPLDLTRPEAAPDDYRTALAQVQSAGMNMLRVAGTMLYEPTAFFDACDAAGVLLWQEFMFASMDYPEHDPDWLALVEQEALQQLQRWQRHACVAVVCGNSEVEQQAAMWGAPRTLWQPALFHERLAALTAECLPDTAYWPSSTHGGALPHAPDAGTSSCYAVGAYLRDLDDARRQAPVFATECLAFANVPPTATLDRLPGSSAGLRVTHAAWKQRSPRDLGAGWDFDDVRDHYLARLCGVDPVTLRLRDHDRYLRLSRAVSGEVMAAAMAEWRRPGSRCRGALIWFWRDLQAGAGWGVLDDQGRPKACWHALRRVLQPQAVLLSDEGHSGLQAHVINEGARPLSARLDLRVWLADRCQEQVGADLELPPHGQTSLMVADLLDHFSDLTDAYRFGPRQHEAVQARLLTPNGTLLAEHWYLPARLQQMPMADALLGEAAPQPDGTLLLRVQCSRLAFGVHVEMPGWSADDEHFHLAPGESREVLLRPDTPAAAARPWRGTLHALNAPNPAPIKASR